MQNWNWVIALLYIALGIYLLDISLAFYPIPEAVSKLNKAIFGIAGAMLAIASFKFFRKNPYPI
jgi:hypothetical protein